MRHLLDMEAVLSPLKLDQTIL